MTPETASAPAEHRHCARCGAPVAAGTRRWPRTWCSEECRIAAYHDRRAALLGRITREPRPPEAPCDECARRVLDSPQAVAAVLREVTAMRRDGRLSDPANAVIRDALREWEDTPAPVA